MLSLKVRTKRTDIGGCKTQTSVTFDSVDEATLDSRSVSGTSGFTGTIYADHVMLNIGYDGAVDVTRPQMVAILKALMADIDWGEFAEALDEED